MRAAPARWPPVALSHGWRCGCRLTLRGNVVWDLFRISCRQMVNANLFGLCAAHQLAEGWAATWHAFR